MKDAMAGGLLDRLGLRAAEAAMQEAGVLAQAASLETVRAVFVDQHGMLRGKTVPARGLERLLRNGMRVPSTLLLKDFAQRTVFDVWGKDGAGPPVPSAMQGAADVLLVPDPHRFHVLPWAPHSAWLFCAVHLPDGAPVAFAPDHVLTRALDALGDAGLSAQFGLEVEFNVYRLTDPALSHDDAGVPGRPVATENLAQGYQFLSDARYGGLAPVIDVLRRHADALGLAPETSEIEMGPGQFEFTFAPGPARDQAHAMTLFRAMVKEVCAAQGLHASFMPKPKIANACANGWHIHQSVLDAASGENRMVPPAGNALGDLAGGWIAGLLDHAAASCLLTGPTVNSYKRFSAYRLAPDRIAWGRDNRGAMLRVIGGPDDPASRVENRVADPSAVPHYAFAGQILSGLDGARRGLRAPPASNRPYDDRAPGLPASLGEAIAAFAASDMYRAALGAQTCDYLIALKTAEWRSYLAAVSDWEQAEYFNTL